MTHLPPLEAGRLRPSPISFSGRPAPPLLGSRLCLQAAVSTKRAEIAALEAAWVAASEAEAARGCSRSVRIDDRTSWDKPTWARYLTAAASYEPEYKPQIRRLLTEIDSLERLLAMPSGSASDAA